MKKNLLIFCLLCLIVQTYAQKLTVTQMQQDLDYAYGKLNANHINPYLYISKAALQQKYQSVRGSLKQPLTKLQFYVKASELVTAMRDGHTIIEPLTDEYDAYAKTNPVFPLAVQMNEDGILVANNALDHSPVQKGDQVISINGHSAKVLTEQFRTLINDVGPLYDVYARLFNQLYWFKYAGSKSYLIEYKHADGQVQTITIAAVPQSQFKAASPANGADFTFKQLNPTTGLLTFSRMFKTKEFDVFLDSTFRVIKQQNISKLIIDIRKNGGGRGRMADSLFNYLTDKPYRQYTGIKYKITQDLKNLYLSHDPNHTDPVDSAFIMSQPNGIVADYLQFNKLADITIKPHQKANRFSGKTILLTSNHTFSGGAIIAGVFKCSGFGQIVGTEPAQSTMFVADHTYFQLPNSKLELGISFIELHLPCEQSYYHGIRPDHEVKPKPEDIKKGIDTQLQYALSLLAPEPMETYRTIKAEDARKHVGETVKICGNVKARHIGPVTLLFSASVKALADSLDGQLICVTGKLVRIKHQPLVRIEKREQIEY